MLSSQNQDISRFTHTQKKSGIARSQPLRMYYIEQ